MKAIILNGKQDISLGEFPDPVLHENDVYVKVAYCGICGSDFHKYEGKQNTHPIRYPVPLGHEISGVVVNVGSAVNGISVGDRVTVDPNHSCGRCSFCQRGMESFCPEARGVVKGIAEYVSAPIENVYRLPEGMSLEKAALTEPLSCCIHGLDKLEVAVGDKVALVGLGAIGAMMLELLKISGASEITVIEPNEEKRELALKMGADRFVSSNDKDEIARLSERGDINRVIECVGNKYAQDTALTVAGMGATVVFFGVADAAERLLISAYDAFKKELTVKTSYVNPHTTDRALKILSSRSFNSEWLISGIISMEEALEEIRNPKLTKRGKVLVKISENL